MPLGDWKNNTIMLWAGNKITDHGRQPLGQQVERIGTDKRMADGTLRRMHIGLKRTWTASWENLPSINGAGTLYKTADGGWSGSQMENFYNITPGKFRMILQKGTAQGVTPPNPAESALPYEDTNFYICNVMLTEFSKEVRKRGSVDYWNVSVTLEEV